MAQVASVGSLYQKCTAVVILRTASNTAKPVESRASGARTYSAWMDGAVESDIAFIKESMELGSAPTAKEKNSTDASVASSLRACRQLDLDDLEDAL
jgi:hypothetical protein